MRIASEVLLAVLNSVWQAALVAGLAWVVLRFARRSVFEKINAATRYAIWWAVLGVVLALPAAPTVVAMWWARLQMAAEVSLSRPAPVRAVAPVLEDRPAIVRLREERVARWPLWIAGLWAALCLFRLAQIGRSYFYLRGVKRRARLAPAEVAPLPAIVRQARLLLSKDVGSPMAVGFLHPAVILPESLPGELARAEMEHVLLHEAAHIARKDDWSNLLAKLLGAALALHPVAWWILRQIEREREMACDDWVVARVGSARPYAQSLARMSELRWLRRPEQGEALASGIFGGGSRLGERIETLLARGRESSPRVSGARVAVGAAMLLGCAAAGAIAPRMIALAQTKPSFEVASVRPTRPGSQNIPSRPRPSDGLSAEQLRSGTFAFTGAVLIEYIEFAYGLKHYQVPDPPRSLYSVYDISAKAGGPVTEQTARQMFQALLEDRFHLKLRRETKELPVWTLVVAKNGPKFKRGAEDGRVSVARPSVNGIAWHNVSMDYLAEWISPLPSLGRVVLDRTGLDGLYDFTLSFDNQAPKGDDPASIKTGLRDALDASIFGSLQDIGLKLEPDKARVDIYTIEHVEPPDEN